MFGPIAAFAAAAAAIAAFAAPPVSPPVAPVAASRHGAPLVRRPVDAALLAGGSLLAVANGRSGTVSVVDLEAGTVRHETKLAASLGGLCAVPQKAGSRAAELLATDAESHRLLLATVDENGATMVLRAASTARHPGAVRLAADNDTIAVACQWSHAVDLTSLSALREPPTRETKVDRTARAGHAVELPFPPRDVLWLLDGRRLVAADAFGGRLAVVDAPARKVVGRFRLTGHNLRGLTLAADRKSLLVAHQILNETAAINWQTVHSGTLMNNVVSRIPLDALGAADIARAESREVTESPERDLDAVRTLIPLGMTGHGAGDPSAIVPLANGGVAALAAGTSELIVVNRFDVITGRIGVGARPVRLVPRADGDAVIVNAVVVNGGDDSLSLVTLDGPAETKRIPLGPRPPEKAADRGERLFFSSRVSHDGWLSCHSCHTDGHSNGLRADTLGDGSLGAPKRVLDLGHVALTDKWAWNGQMQELLEQVRKSLLSTMLSDSAGDAQATDLLAFLEALQPAPPRRPATGDARDRSDIDRGRAVFLAHNCQQCHVPPLTFSASDVYDVGLADEHGNRKFNPPSLRGVGHRPKLFHDNRATSLDDVFQNHGHPNDTSLTNEERSALVRFLKSL